MEFYSHIEKEDNKIISKTLLKEHLKEVGEKIRDYWFFSDKNDLHYVSYYIGLCHDFGKYKTFFQEKLMGIKNRSLLSDHSFISALFTSSFFLKNLSKFENLDEFILKFLPLITFFVVYHHHSDLTSLEEISKKLEDEESLKNVRQQIENLRKNENEIDTELEEIGLNLTVKAFESSLDHTINELLKEKYFYKKESEENKVLISILMLSLFSSLIDADKKCAGKVREVERKEIPDNIVETYKKKAFGNFVKNDLNQMREEIYQNVVSKVDTLDLSKRIYTLTSPTGSGKTLTAFSFAIKLRNRISRELGYAPRIIYSLPFISIIQQNFQILKDVLSNIKDFQGNASNYIIEHHHLSKIYYEEGNEFREVDESLLLIEAWESEVIVTTFIQFLYTIIGFKNRFIKKLHNIARSIIILDEVQNIPVKYWDLVENALKSLSKYLNCYIILMTATRPLIFTHTDSIELLDNNAKYFQRFERVSLKAEFDIDSLDKLREYFLDLYKSGLYSSYLIVLNTIGSSIAMFELLKNSVKNSYIYYLSRNIIPIEGLKRITEIKIFLKHKELFKQKESKETVQNKLRSDFEKEVLESNYNKFLEMAEKDINLIVVSTQVVEAGVDLDFDVVIRDIGPFDSIVQVAGRCNREFRKQTGDVRIVCLKENGEVYTGIYGKTSPEASKRILEKNSPCGERKLYRLIEEYFEEIVEKKSSEDSEDIHKAMLDLRFFESPKVDTMVSDFQLIEETNMFPVFIEVDEKAKEIWNNYSSIVNNGKLSRWEKKNKLLGIKQDFDKYLVSVRVNKEDFAIFRIMEEDGLGHVCFGELEKYYDFDTGFKRNQKPKGVVII